MKKVKATLGGLSAALVLGTLALPATAATVPISTSVAGAVNSSGAYPNTQILVGTQYSGFALFQLPSISGQTITSADVNFSIGRNSLGSLTGANVDVWVLGYVTTLTAQTSWKTWAINSNTDTRTGNTLGTNIGTANPWKVADNLITNGQSVGAQNTNYDLNATQQANLGGVIQSLYKTYGATAGAYLVVRVNPDATSSNFIRLNSTDSTSTGHFPVLTLTTEAISAPEPATAALGVGLLAFAGLGRRRH